MTEPELSVVIASVNGFPYLGECLESLERTAPQAEVIVADWTDDSTRQRVRANWPNVRLLSFDEPTALPELRAAGIAAARAPYVALIEDHCVVFNGWADGLVDAQRAGHSVVGGAIRNGARRRFRDWAAFFCEYSEHMEPMPAGTVDSLPGMNVAYDREAISAMRPLLEQGRWESWLHPHLRESGFAFHCDPRVTIEHAKTFGFREFASQRYHYSRSHSGMLNEQLGTRRRLLYTLGSPALVPLLYSRIARNVFRKRRNRREFLLASPLVLVYLAIWSFGEAVGYALGGGRSILRVR
jgi:glycosyltransferase involved in cell wall biosynthesis